MKWLESFKIKMVLVGFVAAIVLGGGGSAKAEFTFGEPTNLGPTINSSYADGLGCFSSDGLEMYFDSRRYGGCDIYVTGRATIYDDWGTPVNLGPSVNTSAWEEGPSLSADGLELFFHSNRSGGHGGVDLWVSKRPTTQDPWGEPDNLGQLVNSSDYDFFSSISTDGLELYFCSYRPGGYGDCDLWVTTRATTDANWGPPLNLGSPVNSSYLEQTPTILADGVVLFFSSNRPGGFGGTDLWVVTRATTHDLWGTPVNLGPAVNSSGGDAGAHISRDGSTLYFSSTRPGGLGGWDIWQAPILPIVDFNGDERVDFKDFSILAQYWLQDESLVDIAPPPFGDGVVDFKDIVVFAENWLEGTREASNPHPAYGAIGVDINADLSWTAGSCATSHDVYFGTTYPPPFIRNQTAITFDPGTMALNTIYCWRINEVNAWGKTTGTVWHFTTESGPPP